MQWSLLVIPIIVFHQVLLIIPAVEKNSSVSRDLNNWPKSHEQAHHSLTRVTCALNRFVLLILTGS